MAAAVQQISPEQLAVMFPRASRSTIAANTAAQPPAVVSGQRPEIRATPNKLRRGRDPNKTESEFGRILDAQQSRGEHLFHAFEGITLQWGDGMKYTADYAVFRASGRILLIEVKGGYKWQKDVIRYKGCSAQWREFFDFEMHEKKNGVWQRID